jgi:hypothetical protein
VQQIFLPAAVISIILLSICRLLLATRHQSASRLLAVRAKKCAENREKCQAPRLLARAGNKDRREKASAIRTRYAGLGQDNVGWSVGVRGGVIRGGAEEEKRKRTLVSAILIRELRCAVRDGMQLCSEACRRIIWWATGGHPDRGR